MAQPVIQFPETLPVSATSPVWRGFEVVSCCLGLLVLAPLLLAIGLWMLFSDGFPILFRQTRVGRDGKPFQLLKLRSMRKHNSGSGITSAGDPRITPVGRILRRYKLDEIPQLWNVVRGDMALVGPRPEVPEYVNREDPVWKAILARRPGITDLPTLVYRNEEEILARFPHPERHYREFILPDKLSMNLAYGERSSPWRDLRLVLLTVRYSFWPAGFDPEAIRTAFLGNQRRRSAGQS